MVKGSRQDQGSVSFATSCPLIAVLTVMPRSGRWNKHTLSNENQFQREIAQIKHTYRLELLCHLNGAGKSPGKYYSGRNLSTNCLIAFLVLDQLGFYDFLDK